MPDKTPTPPRARQVKFVPDGRPLQGRSGQNPPTWAMIVMVGIIGLVALLFALDNWTGTAIRKHLPFGGGDMFWIGLIFLPMVALLVVAIASKLIELRQAKSWLPAAGRILSSGIETRRHQFEGEPETVKNVPAVKYEFTVGARTVDGTRISIGDEIGLDIEATLKRYPAGAEVTVYYDPRDPTKCVLERDFTHDLEDAHLSKRDVLSGCLGGIAMLAVLGLAIYGLAAYGPDFVRAHFPRLHSHAEMPVAAVGFGLVMLMFFFAARRAAKQAATWPTVRGKIVNSEVEEYQAARRGQRRPHPVAYRLPAEGRIRVCGERAHAARQPDQLRHDRDRRQRLCRKGGGEIPHRRRRRRALRSEGAIELGADRGRRRHDLDHFCGRACRLRARRGAARRFRLVSAGGCS